MLCHGKKVSYADCSFKLACSPMQPDQDFHCLLTESLDAAEYITNSKGHYLVVIHWLMWSVTIDICYKDPFSHGMVYLYYLQKAL